MNKGEWNNYRNKETGELIRACQFTGNNKDIIVNEFKSNNIIEDFWFPATEFIVVNSYIYRNNNDPYATTIDEKLFEKRYEAI